VRPVGQPARKEIEEQSEDLHMKTKLLIPIVALCISGLLGAGCASSKKKKTAPVAKVNPVEMSDLIGATALDIQGDNLGKIRDVLVDPVTGHATFAVVELSGQVGPAGTFSPLPWPLLRQSTGTAAQKTVTFNVDRTKFASAKTFEVWPDGNQALWGPDVYAYYGVNKTPLEHGHTKHAAAGGTGAQAGTQYYAYDPYHYEMDRYGPVRTDGTPIDNGTAPDGKGTFLRGLYGYYY
jgi:hypothetical protein